jgi:chorismate-pyruvate lyase
MEEVIVNGMPESLRRYIVDDCSIPPSSFKLMPGDQLPEPARQLMFHDGDMTSTLAAYYGSEIKIDLIQGIERDEVYLREVFLRTKKSETVVEYGVIAIVLDSFDEAQRRIIEADREPFGGLLHQFNIEFLSAPVCFFAICAEYLADTPFKDLEGHIFYGRFNQLSRPNGQTLAWIMEILPEENEL